MAITSVQRNTSASEETQYVVCTATDAETFEWRVSDHFQNFRLDIDWDTVENSANSTVVVHQGLTLSSVISSTASPGLNNIESMLVFNIASFPIIGNILCACTARSMSGMFSGGTSITISDNNSEFPSHYTTVVTEFISHLFVLGLTTPTTEATSEPTVQLTGAYRSNDCKVKYLIEFIST